MFFHNQSTFTTSPLTLPYRKKIIFIQYNDYIEYFYYLCDVEKVKSEEFLALRCNKKYKE